MRGLYVVAGGLTVRRLHPRLLNGTGVTGRAVSSGRVLSRQAVKPDPAVGTVCQACGDPERSSRTPSKSASVRGDQTSRR